MMTRFFLLFSFLTAALTLAAIVPLAMTPLAEAQTIRVDITPEHAVNTFRPTEALGAGVDRISRSITDKVFTAPVIKRDPVRRLADGHLSAKHRTARGSLALESARELERAGR